MFENHQENGQWISEAMMIVPQPPIKVVEGPWHEIDFSVNLPTLLIAIYQVAAW